MIFGLAPAANADSNDTGKYFVCKYVGTPGVDEVLQTGDNPISVSGNAIDETPVVVGSHFADGQNRSYVLIADTGQAEPDASACPAPQGPPPPPPSTPPPAEKVTLCHATDSNTNPYVEITVDASGAFNGHYTEHKGPIWDPSLKEQHIKWGDIIPPFAFNGQTYSLNYGAQGQAILQAHCTIAPVPPSSSSGSSSGSSSSGSSGSGGSASTSSGAAGAGGGGQSGQGPNGPIPNGVNAGQHAVSKTSLLLGVLLMLAGGGALLTTLRSGKRAH